MNLYGTILGFRRGWKNNKPIIDNYLSFLIFFNHSTGKIEHLKVNNGAYAAQGVAEHTNQDGKLDKSFFMTFLFELFNNKIILKNINDIEADTVMTHLNSPSGAKSKLPNKNSDVQTKEIQIPKLFSSEGAKHSKMIFKFFNNLGYNISINITKNDPLVIKDLKKFIDSTDFSRQINIEQEIIYLNNCISKKISKINNIYQFTRVKLFDSYIEHFYAKKRDSVGAESSEAA